MLRQELDERLRILKDQLEDGTLSFGSYRNMTNTLIREYHEELLKRSKKNENSREN